MQIRSSRGQIPRPDNHVVHVWKIDLGLNFGAADWCESVLSRDELDRARRFVFDIDRLEFVQAHAVVRSLLESYGVAAAKDVVFRISPRGKPEIDPRHGCETLRFNLAHTRGIALWAFASVRDVGIDVERFRVVDNADEIVKRNFAREEQAEYATVDAVLQPTAFLNAWTRKEAFLKALGVGLGRALDSFAVTLKPGEPARLLHVDGHSAAAEEWTLSDLTDSSEEIIALAARGRDLSITCFEWRAQDSHS